MIFESVAYISAECNLSKSFVRVILSFEAFPLCHVFLFVYVHKVINGSAMRCFFYRCVTCVVCECTAWFAVVVKVVYSQSITITAKVTCIITCRLTSCPKCVLFILFVAERPVVSKYEV